ncbi:DUF6376 family protein [Indiicoccus explosivorum]|uniref:DUF6376 family protein n=1 Tax=Indiicoccus explosivorum TaxID=1917864 RepID=UPI000B43A41E|nr:DUF6376 family protein [Indiicoccus explosivorum]
MKRFLLPVTAAAALLLSGCGLLEGVNDTLNYVNEATAYANDAQDFANEVPDLARQAITDPEAAADLETRLEEMKQQIEAFNALEEPAVGGELHRQVVGLNNRALEGIDLYLTNIENGTLDPAVIEDTEIFQTIGEVSDIINQIEQLSQ